MEIATKNAVFNTVHTTLDDSSLNYSYIVDVRNRFLLITKQKGYYLLADFLSSKTVKIT